MYKTAIRTARLRITPKTIPIRSGVVKPDLEFSICVASVVENLFCVSLGTVEGGGHGDLRREGGGGRGRQDVRGRIGIAQLDGRSRGVVLSSDGDDYRVRKGVDRFSISIFEMCILLYLSCERGGWSESAEKWSRGGK